MVVVIPKSLVRCAIIRLFLIMAAQTKIKHARYNILYVSLTLNACTGRVISMRVYSI